MAKEKVQLPGTPNEIVVKVRAQKVLETWLEGLKDPYKHGVCALLVLFAVLLGFRRGEQKARTWTIAKLRWREALGRALAANQYDTTVAQANEVMRAEPKWNVGWNPMLTDADGAKSIRAEVRDKGEPRMKSCKLNSSGIDIEILAQLDARGGKARFAYEIIRAVNAELGCGWDAADPKMVGKLNERLKKLQAKAAAIECLPQRWCRTEWEAGKENSGGSSSAPKYSNPFKVGERVHHDPTGRNGVVVGIEGEVVEFQADGRGHGVGAYGMEQFTLIHKTPAELDAEAEQKGRKQAKGRPREATAKRKKAEEEQPAKPSKKRNSRSATPNDHGEYWR